MKVSLRVLVDVFIRGVSLLVNMCYIVYDFVVD